MKILVEVYSKIKDCVALRSAGEIMLRSDLHFVCSYIRQIIESSCLTCDILKTKRTGTNVVMLKYLILNELNYFSPDTSETHLDIHK